MPRRLMVIKTGNVHVWAIIYGKRITHCGHCNCQIITDNLVQ